jgi:general secretion pathway protein A
MYERYFGFADNPFRLTPDPHYLYLSEGHKEALASLIYGIRARKGFVAVLGEAGTGKTTLLRYLLGQLDQTVRAVCILNTNVTFEELLGFVLRDLGIEAAGASKTEALEAFNHFLHAEFHAGRNVVILVDEAQNLSPVALEELRMLSNFETAKAKLLQIILTGQPHLRDLLAKPGMRQVRQRIGLVCSLDPLNPKDTAAYIKYRLRAAGYRGKPLFTRRAVSAVWTHSRGIPRLINVLCDNALIAAYGSHYRRIGPRLVRAAAVDLEKPLKAHRAFPARSKWWFRTAAAFGLLLLGLGVEPIFSRYSTPLWRAPVRSEFELSSPAHDRLAPPAEEIAESASPIPPRTVDTGSGSPPAGKPYFPDNYNSQMLQW